MACASISLVSLVHQPIKDKRQNLQIASVASGHREDIIIETSWRSAPFSMRSVRYRLGIILNGPRAHFVKLPQLTATRLVQYLRHRASIAHFISTNLSTLHFGRKMASNGPKDDVSEEASDDRKSLPVPSPSARYEYKFFGST